MVGPGPYEDAALAIDKYLWQKRDMVVLFAAGNEGIDVKPPFGRVDPRSIGREASAKNCIAVGASENVRTGLTFGGGRPLQYGRWAGDFAYPPLDTDHLANNQDGLAAFSSRGPTRNQRYKPDVVAPGTCILSARSSRIIQGRYNEFWGVSYDDEWSYQGGTSMACPLVAGCCAVIRGCLIDNGAPPPSAALIKALLINGAVEIRGQYPPSEIGPAPNNDAGFGRVDIPGSLASIVPGPNWSGGYV
ncbi:hypothetical protein OHC33_011166 [Knufia fluminis]|uniref:Peptidase S8/S53 domain-containing protein n=1 Tax=Knufia fluminis TaxID=191047 RepID=A0AAN8I314_9EURO|nr:hypothetical protein OHC33_011166 [Knufia fluminis]